MTDPDPPESPRERREREALDRKIAREHELWEKKQAPEPQRPRLGLHELRTRLPVEIVAEVVPGHGWCPSCRAPLAIVPAGAPTDFASRCRCGVKLEVKPTTP